MDVVPIVAPLKMRVVVVGKKDSVGKLRTQCAQNHQLVISVRTEQTNRANSGTVLALPARVVVFELARQAAQVIRLIQPLRCLNRGCLLAEWGLLSLVALSVFAQIPRQLTVDSTKVMIRVNPRRSLLGMLNDIIGALPGGLSCERRAQGTSVRSVPFAQNHDVGDL